MIGTRTGHNSATTTDKYRNHSTDSVRIAHSHVAKLGVGSSGESN